MLMTMRRVLSFPVSSNYGAGGGSDSVSPANNAPLHKGKLPMEQIKQRMQLALHDVTGVNADRLQFRIRSAVSVNELWMLRSDMYQVISMLHNQSEAARRINSLLTCFSQWIANKQLSVI
jgi:hypothetical protein